jgi:hypothetical protein
MLELYKVFLRLYPRDYSDFFGAEMLSTFIDSLEGHRREGSAALARFEFVELGGLIRGAMFEWIAKIAHSVYHSSSYIENTCLPDRHLMRPAGVARELYFGHQTSIASRLGDEGMCVNAHQRFVFASPLKRLVILVCALFLPLHSTIDTKLETMNHQH